MCFDVEFVTDLSNGRNFKLAPVSFGFVPSILWTFPCCWTQDVPGSSCTFPPSALELAIHQGVLSPLDFLMFLFFFHSSLFPKSALIHPWNFHLISFSPSSIHTSWVASAIPVTSEFISPSPSALPAVITIYIYNYLLDTSNPVSHSHLKLSGLKLYLFTLPPSKPQLPYIPYYC